jgi:hypothetical protein
MTHDIVAAIPMFVPSAAEQLAAVAIKCLAVGGAFLAGYAIGGAIVYALNKWVFAEKTPETLRKTFRVLAGIALAILVAMIVFGDGSGGGLFGGSGANGAGKGNPDADSKAKDKGDTATPPVTQSTPKEKPKSDEPAKRPSLSPGDVEVTVTFLGGSDAVGDKFYKLDGQAMSFETLKDETMKKQPAPPGRIIVQPAFLQQNRVPRDTINFTQVQTWATSTPGIGWFDAKQ